MRKFFILCVMALLPSLSVAETLTVQVDKAQLRGEPSFFGKILANLGYNSAVEVLQKQGAWRLVRYKGKEGWMHTTALLTNTGKIGAGVGIVNSSVSSREVSMAGKGFDKNVENAYKKEHRELNFAAVDKLEKINLTSSELEKFATGSDFSQFSR